MATSTQKLRAMTPALLGWSTSGISSALKTVGVPALLQGKLLGSVSSKVEGEIRALLDQGPEHVDNLLGTVAGWCAGFRSDDNPLRADELPAPFGVDELRELHNAATGDPVR